jgi:hypothetical protein
MLKHGYSILISNSFSLFEENSSLKNKTWKYDIDLPTLSPCQCHGNSSLDI